jgi:hypothetical protein
VNNRFDPFIFKESGCYRPIAIIRQAQKTPIEPGLFKSFRFELALSAAEARFAGQ